MNFIRTSLISALLVTLAASSAFSQEKRSQRSQRGQENRVEVLSQEVSQLIEDHLKDMTDGRDHREIMSALRNIKDVFEYRGFFADDVRSENKFYYSQCKVNGQYGSKTLGPASDIEELETLCKNAQHSNFKNQTFLDEISSVVFPRNAYLKGSCKVNGQYGTKNVGPSKSVADLVESCRLAQHTNFRNAIFVDGIEVVEF